MFESRRDVPYAERNFQTRRYKHLLLVFESRRDVPYAERNFQTRRRKNRFFHRVQKNLLVLESNFKTY